MSEDDEADHGSDPNNPDTDTDGLTDPSDPDSDNDGFNDGAEVDGDTDPLDVNDHPSPFCSTTKGRLPDRVVMPTSCGRVDQVRSSTTTGMMRSVPFS